MSSNQIILLHGALGASDQLNKLSEVLNKNRFQTFAFNFSGHGKSEFQQQFNIAQFAIELKNFISENKITKPNIFGYSMGGYVALYLAKQNPDVLGKIVTLGTKFNWTPEISQKEIKNLIPEIIEEKVPKFAQALKNRHGEDWKKLLRKTSEMMLDMGEKNPMKLNDFKEIKSKVYIGLGENDQMVSKTETEEICRIIPGAEFYMMPQTKHPIEAVDVIALGDKITEFLT